MLRFSLYGAVDVEKLSNIYWMFGTPWKFVIDNAIDEWSL